MIFDKLKAQAYPGRARNIQPLRGYYKKLILYSLRLSSTPEYFDARLQQQCGKFRINEHRAVTKRMYLDNPLGGLFDNEKISYYHEDPLVKISVQLQVGSKWQIISGYLRSFQDIVLDECNGRVHLWFRVTLAQSTINSITRGGGMAVTGMISVVQATKTYKHTAMACAMVACAVGRCLNVPLAKITLVNDI